MYSQPKCLASATIHCADSLHPTDTNSTSLHNFACDAAMPTFPFSCVNHPSNYSMYSTAGGLSKRQIVRFSQRRREAPCPMTKQLQFSFPSAVHTQELHYGKCSRAYPSTRAATPDATGLVRSSTTMISKKRQSRPTLTSWQLPTTTATQLELFHLAKSLNGFV